MYVRAPAQRFSAPLCPGLATGLRAPSSFPRAINIYQSDTACHPRRLES